MFSSHLSIHGRRSVARRLAARATGIAVALTTLGLMVAGCADPSELDFDEKRSGIELGVPEAGFPGVGLVNNSATHGFCTGTLVSDSWVLTATHCLSPVPAMTFKTDDGVVHAVDRYASRGADDLAVMHLSSPIAGANTIPVSDGPPPAINDICLAVGFGKHVNPDGTVTQGLKRSGTEKVTSVSAGIIEVTLDTGGGGGLADHGDSGSPLICNGVIVGEDWRWPDGTPDDGKEWEEGHRGSVYTKVDWRWISSYVAPIYQDLTLFSGWSNIAFRNAGAALVSGLVQLKGTIVSATPNTMAFQLPTGLRPANPVHLSVAFATGTGQLTIDTTGFATVKTDGTTGPAVVSLEGVSFPPTAFTNYVAGVSLQSGWIAPLPSAGGEPKAAVVDGIVHLSGAVVAQGNMGQNMTALHLPSIARPAKEAYLPVVMANGTRGHVLIFPDGGVFLEAAGIGNISNALTFTSFDGVSYPAAPTPFTAVSLGNGWVNNLGAGTDVAGFAKMNGIVHLKGDIIGGSSPPFILPLGFRPSSTALIAADFCGARKGYVGTGYNGVVGINNGGGGTQCMASLEGVSFSTTEYTDLPLMAGWQNVGFGTGHAAAAVIDGVVHLKGVMKTTGGDPTAFRLPAGMRPSADVYVTVDLNLGAQGQLLIEPSGKVSIASNLTAAAQYTSLNGVSFVVDASGATSLTLLNGWTGNASSTGPARAKAVGGSVYLSGGISTNGTNMTPFVLPASFRPGTTIYVTADQFGGLKGRLQIDANGNVTVQTSGNGSEARSFTSLDGVSFSQSTVNPNLILNSGWQAYPASRNLSAFRTGELVTLTGALSTTNGAGTVAFQLPAEATPSVNLSVPVDLCNAQKGRLFITTAGNATVVAAPGVAWSAAQCFTSLEGVTFAP